MRRNLLLAIMLIMVSGVIAKDKVVEKPFFGSGGISFRPNTVVTGKSFTTVGFRVFAPGTWNLAATSCLVSDGRTYHMREATVFKRSGGTVSASEPLDPSRHYTWDYDSVSAVFEPLEKSVRVFDFIETETSNFNVYGIRLDRKPYPFFLGKPKAYPYAKDEPLAPITPMYGKARYVCHMYRHDGTEGHPAMFGVNNSFSEERFMGFTRDSYEIESSHAYYAPIGAPNPFQQFSVMMIPGYETRITVDETASMAVCAQRYTKTLPTDRLIQFEGPIADLQQVNFEERAIYSTTFGKASPETLWETLQRKIGEIESKTDYSRRQKDFGRLKAEAAYLARYLKYVADGRLSLTDTHAADLGILKDGRAFYIVRDAEYLPYAHHNNVKGVVTEWMEGYARAMNMAKRIRGLELMTDEAFDSIPEIYRKELCAMNDSTRSAIERLRQTASEVTVMDTPDCTGDKFIQRVVSENPGMVVFFDFWATWCGPCQNGIKAMEKLKKTWAGKPVRFVYVTNETSPSNQWTRQIADMPGLHYRLPDDIWRAIPDLDGIPQYYIYDGHGKLFYEQTGFSGIEPLRQKIEEAIENNKR